MTSQQLQKTPVPTWMKIVIICCMLPVLAFPTLISALPQDSPVNTLVWLYPLYVLATGICAWVCYGQRRELSWILLVLMLLSHAAIWTLVWQS